MLFEYVIKKWHYLRWTKEINLGCSISESREEGELVFRGNFISLCKSYNVIT